MLCCRPGSGALRDAKEFACLSGGGPACCLQRSAPTSTATGAQAAFNDADVRFLQAMIPHHQQAIDATKLVRSRTDRSQLVKLADAISMKTHHLGAIRMASSILQAGRSPEVRMLATQILTAQQDEVDQLTRWHDAWS